jgi:hypothetical protein
VKLLPWPSSLRSFKPKDGPEDRPPSTGCRNAQVDFRGKKRSNEMQASTTDPETFGDKHYKGRSRMV